MNKEILFQICRCLGTCFGIQATLQFKIMMILDAVAGTLSSDFCHFSSTRWSRARDCLCGSQQQRLMNVDKFMQSDLHDSIWALCDFHRGYSLDVPWQLEWVFYPPGIFRAQAYASENHREAQVYWIHFFKE